MSLFKRGASLLTAGIFVAGGCGEDGRGFENREGDIVAQQPATVLEVWHHRREIGKGSPKGYKLYLVTEDCPEDETPTDGPDINPDCEPQKHPVNAPTFRGFSDGDSVHWEDRDSESEVVQHRFGTASGGKVYDFSLLVRQCVNLGEPSETCVEDFVLVDFETWYAAREGDILTFSGDPGEVVSE